MTRRCLDCDHTFCLGEPATAAGQPRGKKRKRGGPCKAEFDYTGWKARGAWRRTVLLNGDNNNNPPVVGTNTATAGKSEQKWGNEHRAATESLGDETRFEDKRERLFVRRRHNCFLHCDFPSECHHSLFRAQQEGRPILREAEALAAAEAATATREAEGREGKRRTRRLTVQEYKQRRADRRRRSVPGSATAPVAGRFVEDLSTVTEEETEDYEEGDTVSPCSPTSPDPPGDLMREVSPVENNDDDKEQPLSPSGRSRRERASLLVTTDTPADFATTAAPLSFDDTYSDDEDEELGEHEGERRTKSRRKAAQPTSEHPESLGPFILDTSAPSPTSPLSASATNNTRAAKVGRSSNPTALDLQAAWSEQAWFSSSTPTAEPLPSSPKSPERVGTRDRMFALLGRRGSASPTSPRTSHDVFDMPSRQQQQQRQVQHHADTTAVAGEEEWESWSDSSTSSTSSTSSGASLLSSSSAEHGAVASTIMDITDADGDVPMCDATAASPTKDADEHMDAPMTNPPTGEQRAGARRGGGDGAEEDLRALLRMRNAVMRGEML